VNKNSITVPPIFREWFSGEPGPAFLLAGEGPGLADLVAEMWIERFRSEGKTAELYRWTQAELERESPEVAWRTPSFFCRFRVFILPDLGELKKAYRDAIAAYLASPDPSVILVFPCSDRAVTKTFSAISSVRSAHLREDQAVSALARIAAGKAKAGGKEMSGDAAAFLVRWVGTEYARLNEEIGKLVSFAGDRKEIGEEEIRKVCIASGAVDPFDMADTAVRKDLKGFLTLFRRFAAGAESGDYIA
jgi:DNA polymerase III delta subunit